LERFPAGRALIGSVLVLIGIVSAFAEWAIVVLVVANIGETAASSAGTPRWAVGVPFVTVRA